MSRALFIHGLGSNSESWWRARGQLRLLGWDADAVELRGHGTAPRAESYALDDYAADLASERGTDVAIGHSLGGAIAVTCQRDDPGWASALVLVDPVLHVDTAQRGQLRAEQAAEAQLDAATVRAMNPGWDRRDVDAKVNALAQLDPAAATRTFDDNPEWDLRDAARALEVPTLIIGGDPDVFTLFDPQLGAELVDANPVIEYVIITGAGHSPHRDDPGAVRRALMSWAMRVRR